MTATPPQLANDKVIIDRTIRIARKKGQLASKFKLGVEWQKQQDWEALKEDFFESKNVYGILKYKTVSEYAHAAFPNRGSVNWPIVWFMRSVGNVEHPPLQWYGDWEQERLLSTYRFTKHLRTLKEKLEEELDLVATGRTLADSYLPLQQRVFDFWKEVETHLGGTIFLDTSHIDPSKGKTKKERAELQKEKVQLERLNMKRVGLFMKTTEWVVELKTKIDNQFLRMLGWDRPQFLELFEKMRLEAVQEGRGSTVDGTVNSLLRQLAADQIEKAKMYELPLPDDIQAVADKIKTAKEEEKEETA